MILVELGKDRGDLALAKSIVERVVNVGRQNAESRGCVTINGQRRQQSIVQLVRSHIAKLRNAFSLATKRGVQ